jgi:hypothetical protein
MLSDMGMEAFADRAPGPAGHRGHGLAPLAVPARRRRERARAHSAPQRVSRAFSRSFPLSPMAGCPRWPACTVP